MKEPRDLAGDLDRSRRFRRRHSDAQTRRARLPGGSYRAGAASRPLLARCRYRGSRRRHDRTIRVSPSTVRAGGSRSSRAPPLQPCMPTPNPYGETARRISRGYHVSKQCCHRACTSGPGKGSARARTSCPACTFTLADIHDRSELKCQPRSEAVRPPGAAFTVGVRCHGDFLAAVDTWRGQQEAPTSRAAAIRRLAETH